MKIRLSVVLIVSLALALSGTFFANGEVVAQETGETCITGTETGVLCDVAGPPATSRLGCNPILIETEDGRCFRGETPLPDGSCGPGAIEDPALPRCLRAIELEQGDYCDPPWERARDGVCIRTVVQAGVSLTCDQGILILDHCEIYTEVVFGAPECPGGSSIVEVNDACYQTITLSPGESCPAGFGPVAGLPCARETQKIQIPTCTAVDAEIEIGALCTSFRVPRGLPAFDCAARDSGSPRCNDITQHSQNGSFDGALLSGQQTTIKFFDCAGLSAGGFGIFTTTRGASEVLRGTLVEGPAGVYTGTYTAPGRGTYVVRPILNCPRTPVLYDLVQFPSCNGVAATIDLSQDSTASATQDDDVIVGTDLPDIIDGLGGDDNICGAGGDDRILGNDGDDILAGGNGRDFLYGNNGNDIVHGGLAIDRIWGNAGDDELIGGGGSDRIRAGSGADIVFAGSGADRVWGGSGNDMLFGMGGQDFMRGEAGNDLLQGNFQSDRLWGGSGNDDLRGAQGKDKLRGGPGDDAMSGGDNTDFLDGGDGTDIANGQRGKDNPLVPGVSGCIAETVISC